MDTPITRGANVADLLAKTALSAVEQQLLEILVDSSSPTGAWVARDRLQQLDHDVSSASVSRLLSRLDALGLTQSAGGKGRVVTATGRRLGEYARDARARNSAHEEALQIQTVDQVLDLLRARRAIESEAARAAAGRCVATEIVPLRQLVAEHRAQLEREGIARAQAMSFHRELSRLSGNPLLIAMSDTILSERLEYLERVLDVVTSGHDSFHHSVDDHENILHAVEFGDGDGAFEIMQAHLSRLVREVESFAESDSARAFSSVLGLATP